MLKFIFLLVNFNIISTLAYILVLFVSIMAKNNSAEFVIQKVQPGLLGLMDGSV